jgi:uncharacterized protein (TIGR02391 family)
MTAAAPGLRRTARASLARGVRRDETLNNRVKDLSGLDTDGKGLMSSALFGDAPRVQAADLSSENGRNIQEGVRFLLMEVMQAFRNPGAHDPFPDLIDEEAFEQLGFASLLMRQLDRASATTDT